MKLVPAMIESGCETLSILAEAIGLPAFIGIAEISIRGEIVSSVSQWTTTPVGGITAETTRQMETAIKDFLPMAVGGNFSIHTKDDIVLIAHERYIIAVFSSDIDWSRLLALIATYSLKNPVKLNLVTSHHKNARNSAKKGSFKIKGHYFSRFYRAKANAKSGYYYKEDEDDPISQYVKQICLITAVPLALLAFIKIGYDPRSEIFKTDPDATVGRLDVITTSGKVGILAFKKWIHFESLKA